MRVKNLTPFLCGPKVTSRRPPQPEMALVVRGTFALRSGEPLAALDRMEQGAMTAEELAPDDDERRGECFYPGDFADFKANAEVMLRGSAHPPSGKPVTELPVRFSVGGWSKLLRVVGRRVWKDRVLGSAASEPEPFVALPITWANAYGGPEHAENPVGKGYKTTDLHHLELPGEPAHARSDKLHPACFGPVNPAWPQRAVKVGKDYGKAWRAERKPFYAKDFDWSYFQAAPADQQISGYLRGDEEVVFQNLHPEVPVLVARLPSVRIRAFVKGTDGRFREVPMNLDTLFADLDAERVFLTWRGLDAVREDDLADVATVLIASEPLASEPLPADHYRALLEAFEADPIGLQAAVPAGLAELEARLEEERAEGLSPDVPVYGSLDRAEAVMKALIATLPANERAQAEQSSPGFGRAGGMDLRAKMAAQMEADAAPPVMSRKPGSMPPVRVGPPMRALAAQIEKLKATPGAKDHPQLAALEAQIHDPRLREIDPTYRPPRPDDPPPDEPGPGRNLSGQDLTGRDLHGMDLRGIDLEGAILTRADLRGADLRGAKLRYAILYKAELGSANLEGADLTMAQLSHARAAGASFKGAVLQEAWFEEADLRGAVLADATGEYVQLARADLTGAKAASCRLPRSSFAEATLEGADLSSADLSRCSFGEARARGVDLSRAKLLRASFEAADLRDARLLHARGDGIAWMRAKLDGADLRYAWMPDAFLIEVSANRANFTEANLKGARLYRAVAEDALFVQANLFSADLRKATLSRSRFTGANLYNTTFFGAAGKGCDFNGANLKKSTLETQG